MEKIEICIGHSLLYQWYALFLEAKGKWQDAHMVYQIGISRKAEPLEKLKEAHSLFLDRISGRLNATSLQKVDEGELIESEKSGVNPWSSSTMEDQLKRINAKLIKYDGYRASNKVYLGKVALPSGKNLSRNKIIELGGKKYQIKGCAGQGGFAEVFKAFVNSDPEDVVALKDVINSYVVIGKSMEEVLCIYYTIEMLCILESLHNVGIIHGDFKPDNLLIRYARDDLTIDGFHNHSGSWRDQVDTYGLCVIVHMMLHGGPYLEVEKKTSPDGGFIYQPKSSFKRYWNVDLWKNLFSKLLNIGLDSDKEVLRNLRESFQDYMCSNPQLLKKLIELLAKQRASLCSA
ncbi:hypothetical protein LWI29_031169 [Acer saccharum]|uniref:Uncharacterized protein n=1 Tax=Acer saccharum TaxID=4024 RepID=A0AA39SKR5_ACESA|nr:hypothetical protein LWI29_031169 [Acer saccharum]